jgi:hypothetical protein
VTGDVFHSFFWHDGVLTDPALRDAHAELMSPSGRDAYRDAFRMMLHSGHPMAVGVALDHFQHADALTRFGGTSALGEDDVLEVARGQLRMPPVAGGASHASALNAMMNLAQPEDMDLITACLAVATDINVRLAASMAAHNALRTASTGHAGLVAELGKVAFDESLDADERADALAALGESRAPEAVALLVRGAESGVFELEVRAAWNLVDHDAHLDLVRRVVAGWPEDARYPASEVRDALHEREASRGSGGNRDGIGDRGGS